MMPVGKGPWSAAAAKLVRAAEAGEIATSRVAIRDVLFQGDAALDSAKTIVNSPLRIEAQLFADGHDAVAGALRMRRVGEQAWREVPLQQVDGDRFAATIVPDELGAHELDVTGWIDHFETWRHAFPRRMGEDAALNLRVGAELVQDAAGRATGSTRERLTQLARTLEAGGDEAHQVAMSDELAALMRKHPSRAGAVHLDKPIEVQVNRELANFGSWYQVFPRSLAKEPGVHGTLRDTIDDLDRIKSMGFDVVYLPPISPIGSTFRKGANNAATAAAHEPGVPYAIGSAAGGHNAIHPQLGTMDDFDALVTAAKDRDMEIAMDLAFQASPDHPWVKAHPEWFRKRPDGTIQYAENPPKKYQDVYPFDFESPQWPELWAALTDSTMQWADRGVRAFRVDNPHTKPFAFWKHLISEVKAKHPDTVFLSEAFARPNIQDELARAGFDQTYTYFPWKTKPHELRELGEHYAANGRPHLATPSHWPTTHDILPENLQGANRDQFALRATLAGTMSPTWGNYGPSYEAMENVAREAGSIEFLNSEKYQLRHWLRDGTGLEPVLTRINEARRAAPALQSAKPPQFLDTTNPELVAFLRSTRDGSDNVVVVGNTDPGHAHSGFVDLPLERLGIKSDEPFEAVDLLDGSRYRWTGARQFVELAPGREMGPAHVLQLRRLEGA